MSNNDYLRLVTLPPTLASATMCGLLPSPPSSKLLVPLPNKRRRQALHVRQLLVGMSQLQSTLTDGFCNPNCPCFSFEPFKLCVDTGQVIVQFVVACDIHSDTPVIKSVGCFGKVSINGGGTNKELVEPGRNGVNGLGQVDGPGIDWERVWRIQGSLLLSVCLNVSVKSGGDPIGLGIRSFAQWDLEVGIHGVADISVRSSFVGLGIPFNSGFEPLDLVLEGKDSEPVDLFTVLDGLDQTGCNLLEGDGVDIGIGGEYVFHSMRGVAGWG